MAAYYFRGKAIEESTIAENMARPGEIIISAEVLHILRATVTIETIGSPNFFRIRALKFPTWALPRRDRHRSCATPSAQETVDRALSTLVARFVPSAIRQQTVQGEFRQVVSLMLNLPETMASDQIEQVLAAGIRFTGAVWRVFERGAVWGQKVRYFAILGDADEL